MKNLNLLLVSMVLCVGALLTFPAQGIAQNTQTTPASSTDKKAPAKAIEVKKAPSKSNKPIPKTTKGKTLDASVK